MIISTLKQTLAAIVVMASPLVSGMMNAQALQKTLHIYDKVTFYDQYLVKSLPDEAKNLNDGILRHTTSSYSRKLTADELALMGDKLTMKLRVYACCDNYDRLGNVNFAFVPKGSASYEYDKVKRIEIGRFITPFMDKNLTPKSVTYKYTLDYLSNILRDSRLLSKYDIWVEYELFGVPYAANSQISGCAGRNDVFQASLDFVTSQPAAAPVTNNVVVPITMKNPEYHGNDLNNYNANATDTIGKTTRTYTFTVPENVTDAQLVIVTSNHGAGGYQTSDGVIHYGEEYCRRMHFIYYDDDLALTYKPGRTSCEKFRVYNTQPNGIYGTSQKTDTEWQSFSNWCPGDVIDNRIIKLGNVKAGTHKVRISVPDAEFLGNEAGQHDGNIPVSIFFQGLSDGSLPSSVNNVMLNPDVKDAVKMTVSGGTLTLDSEEKIMGVELYSGDARLLKRQYDGSSIDISSYGKGLYVVCVELESGVIVSRKLMF